MNSLKGVSGRALCALIGRLTAMEYLPYEHFRAFASQLVTHFRTERHLECLLAMFRYAASLRAEYFIEDEHFLLSVTKVLCIRSSAVFVREAPEVRIMHLSSLRFRFLTIFSKRLPLASAISFIVSCSKGMTASTCSIRRTRKKINLSLWRC